MLKFHSLFGSGVKVWSVFVWALLFSCSHTDPKPNILLGTWKYQYWELPGCNNPDYSSSQIKPLDQIIITNETFDGNHYTMNNNSIDVTYPSKHVIYTYTYLAVNGQRLLTLSWKLDTGCTVNGNYSI
jgi:hypothetical protein